MKIEQNQPLLAPITIGDLKLSNRIVMSPMTRGRAKNGEHIPNSLTAEYYSQRATAGLIITEGTWTSRYAIGFPHVPGIYTQEQKEGWKPVTRAVHEKGGLIFLQLGHFGGLAHPDYMDGERPLGASAVRISEMVFTPTGPKPGEAPKEMTAEDIKHTLDEFGAAAQNAKDAGFDGVEIHAQGKSLISQFLSDTLNNRVDGYGGSIEKKARFLFEVLERVFAVWGPGRVSIRFNPFLSYSGDSGLTEDVLSTYEYVIKKLSGYHIAFLHIVDRAEAGMSEEAHRNRMTYQKIRSWFSGIIVGNGGLELETANSLIGEGLIDMASFGTKYIANPDLAYRFEQRLELNVGDPGSFYTGDEEGYTDYPLAARLQPDK